MSVSRGFTLLEVTVSLALCATLLSALVPVALQLQRAAEADAVTADNIVSDAAALQPPIPTPNVFPALCANP